MPAVHLHAQPTATVLLESLVIPVFVQHLRVADAIVTVTVAVVTAILENVPMAVADGATPIVTALVVTVILENVPMVVADDATPTATVAVVTAILENVPMAVAAAATPTAIVDQV